MVKMMAMMKTHRKVYPTIVPTGTVSPSERSGEDETSFDCGRKPITLVTEMRSAGLEEELSIRMSSQARVGMTNGRAGLSASTQEGMGA